MLAVLNGLLEEKLAPGDPDDDDAPRAKRFLEPADSYPDQWEAVTTEEREVMLLVGRQGGKTSSCLLRMVKLATEKPRSKCLYVCFDLDIGREVVFEAAQELLTRLGWKFEANGTRLRIKLENGSVLQVKSADDLRSVNRLRGRNWDLIIVDEIQELASEVAKKLVVDVIGPMQFRRSGALVLAFTPPEVQDGWLWEEFTSGRWKLLQWGMGKNRFLPAGEVERWLKKRGLTIDHPIARREVLGLWEPNTENFVYSGFDYRINVFDPGVDDPTKPAVLPVGEHLPKDQWAYGIGSDIGWQHDDSIILVGWNRHDPQKRIYEVLTWRANHQDMDQLFARFQRTWRSHRPVRSVVMDQAGAGGQKVIATIENRFRELGLPITIDYKPTNVAASVGLVNDAFRTGQLLLRKDSPLLAEIPKTVWKSGTNRQEIDKGKFDPHGLDGLRYAVWGATNYRSKGRNERQLTAEEERARYLDQKHARVHEVEDLGEF